MLKSEDFKNIIEEAPTPIIIGEPVLTDGTVSDVRLLYANASFNEAFPDLIQAGDFYSVASETFSANFEWKKAVTLAIQNKETVRNTMFSKKYSKWLQISINSLTNGLINVTILDISTQKERENQLKQQNQRLATLTEELSASKENLKLKLDSIEALNSKLEYTAYHDSLTELFNKKKLYEDLSECTKNAESKNEKFGIILLDLDNMKAVNDSQGHIAGDEFLKKCSSLLKRLQRDTITAYRFGGDEFVIIIKDLTSKDTILNIGDAILELFNDSGINFSAGISVCPDDTTDMEELLKFADMAMYDVKKKGRNSVKFFRTSMQERFLKKHNIQTRIAEALERNDFQLYYQPQFDIGNNSLRGFEALLRWHDELLGWINPEQFIPVAEETHLVIPIGNWVLRTALSTLKEWTDKYNFSGVMSVNISPIQLKQPDFIFNIKDWIKEFDIDPKKLELEITEGILIDNKEEAVRILLELREMGIGISLDDFGTGYSSLNYLQMLPITTLKIDKSFIANITSKGGVEANITNSIVSMVTKMGLDTIAEGVENPEQLRLLNDMHCKNMQGFLKGKPMTEERCAAMLSGDEDAVQTIKNES